MDGVRELLEEIQKGHKARGNFLGLLHVLIGRRISKADGPVISTGQTWRDVSNLLKIVRWDPETARELGIDPETLPPRDRQRYWYSAIAQAQLSSDVAIKAGDWFAATLTKLGYVVGAPPGVH